jgi:large subunit ribosomal protein LP1
MELTGLMCWIATDGFVQAEKLQTLIKAAKIEDVEPIWTSLFAKVRH